MNGSNSSTVKLCAYPGCTNPKRGEWCSTHYAQKHRTGEMWAVGESPRYINMGKACSFDGCGRAAKSRGLCTTHYHQDMYGVEGGLHPIGFNVQGVCSVPDCGKEAVAKHYCTGHYQQWIVKGVVKPLKVPAGRYLYCGYVKVKRNGHSRADKDGFVYEHLLAMEDVIGRPLLPKETVHHKNGDRADNRPENLELWASRHPKGQRVVDLVEFAREILELYGDEVP